MAEVIWNKQAENEWRKNLLSFCIITWRVQIPLELQIFGIRDGNRQNCNDVFSVIAFHGSQR
jgi:hypothetical protein